MSREMKSEAAITADEAVNQEIQRLLNSLRELGAQRDASLALSLIRTFTAIVEEASRTARFAKALTAASRQAPFQNPVGAKTKSRRRSPGAIDPFAVYNEKGEDGLRQNLEELDIEGLRDIVAEHGMDSDRLAMKWKDPTRVIERIVTRVATRSAKGSAFR